MDILTLSRGTESYQRLEVLFNTFGSSNYIGEPVSLIEHSLQAAFVANSNSDNFNNQLYSKYFNVINERVLCDEELVISCLLHDIGHVLGIECGIDDEMQMEGCGTINHEHFGAEFLLQLGFSKRVVSLLIM